MKRFWSNVPLAMSFIVIHHMYRFPLQPPLRRMPLEAHSGAKNKNDWRGAPAKLPDAVRQSSSPIMIHPKPAVSTANILPKQSRSAATFPARELSAPKPPKSSPSSARRSDGAGWRDARGGIRRRNATRFRLLAAASCSNPNQLILHRSEPQSGSMQQLCLRINLARRYFGKRTPLSISASGNIHCRHIHRQRVI